MHDESSKAQKEGLGNAKRSPKTKIAHKDMDAESTNEDRAQGNAKNWEREDGRSISSEGSIAPRSLAKPQAQSRRRLMSENVKPAVYKNFERRPLPEVAKKQKVNSAAKNMKKKNKRRYFHANSVMGSSFITRH